MELRHLRYFCAVAEYGTFREAGRHLHVSQSAISEQVADLEHEIGGALLERSQRSTRLTRQGEIFLEEAKKTLLAAERTVDLTRRSLLGQEGTLAIGFFLWGAGGFFTRIIRDYRKLHPNIKLSLMDMHAHDQMAAMESGQLDIGFTRPLVAPYDKLFRSEPLYNDPIVVVMPKEHPLAKGPVTIQDLAAERWVLCERPFIPALFDSIIALCTSHGFSPNIVNGSSTWSGVMTLVEAGEGIGLVPSGARYIRPPGLVFCELEPNITKVGLSLVWNPLNEGPVVKSFLKLVRENKERIRKSAGN
ncbi:LysR family transcriptional regulator [Granulicella tundricola]|uniref:Transcriptional regulator, LysR family n=1 Tax=Granulicella tundricola (strain ATCC BAA-1859 / DSM 23138 / MP5ACTX9) TaxID=1198114 RepID=E8WXY9_GRATM|nr:LysR family transcriptional regulator [Granulicella tundricola]ADW67528.1 transcriptional regulator, LysR family [Granulicella tundricola MP5ACTX9]